MPWQYNKTSRTFHSSAMIDGQYRDLVTDDTAANLLYALIDGKDLSDAASIYRTLDNIFNQSHKPIQNIALCVDDVGEYYIKHENSAVGTVYTLVIEKLFNSPYGQITNYTPGKDLHLSVQADTSGESLNPVYSILEDTIDIDWYTPE